MKSALGIARSAVFGLGFRLERDEATTEDPDQEGSEQPWIEGEGHGFAEGDLLGAMDLVQFVIQTPVQSFKLFELPFCDLWIIAIGMYGSVIWYMAVR
jgi:hypothetical protein